MVRDGFSAHEARTTSKISYRAGEVRQHFPGMAGEMRLADERVIQNAEFCGPNSNAGP